MFKSARVATIEARARHYARKGRWQDAGSRYERLVALSPRRGSSWVQLGHALKEQGELERALVAYREAARLMPQLAEIHLHIGDVNKQLGRHSAAVEGYCAALKLNNALDAAVSELVALGCEDEARRIRDGEMLAIRHLLDEHKRVLDGHTHALIGRLTEQGNRQTVQDDRLAEQNDLLMSQALALEATNTAFAERAAQVDQRIEQITRQMGTLLEHISAAKALGFEFARLKTVVDALSRETVDARTSIIARMDRVEVALTGVDAIGGRLDPIERRLDEAESRANRAETISDTLAGTMRMAEIMLAAIGDGARELDGRMNRMLADAIARLDAQRDADLTDRRHVSRRLSEVESLAFTMRGVIDDLSQVRQRIGHQPCDGDRERPAEAARDAKLSSFEHATAAISRGIAEAQDRILALEQRSTVDHGQAHASQQDNAVKDLITITNNHEDMLRFLLGRVEFVRRELMYEMKYGVKHHAGRDRLAAEPHIKNAAKIEAAIAAGGLTLNIGCGHIIEPADINVDSRDLPGIDVVAEAEALPFEPGSVAEIRSSHLLEHFPQEALARSLLPHWVSLLRPGGRLLSIVPDGQAMVNGYADRTYPFEEFRLVLFGAQDYDGDFHFNLFTPDSLTAILRDAGLTDIRVIESGRRNGDCFEFEIEARKPMHMAGMSAS